VSANVKKMDAAWNRYYRTLTRIENERRMKERKAQDRLNADLKEAESHD